jgi:hypothetical protein
MIVDDKFPRRFKIAEGDISGVMLVEYFLGGVELKIKIHVNFPLVGAKIKESNILTSYFSKCLTKRQYAVTKWLLRLTNDNISIKKFESAPLILHNSRCEVFGYLHSHKKST